MVSDTHRPPSDFVPNHGSRLTLYFPVSALVTLFGNILQNPMDPRARSDAKLMNMVVTFLSTLGQEAETGGVHRMLGVCSEFERIAKIVIDKTEKEAPARRKRKSHDHRAPGPAQTAASRPGSADVTPKAHYGPGAYPSPGARSNGNAYSPMNTASSANGQAPRDGQGSWPQDHPSTGPVYDTPNLDDFADLTGFGQPVPSPPMPNANINGFQPLLPQDLWQMPMALDWEWAELSGGVYPGFESHGIGQAPQ